MLSDCDYILTCAILLLNKLISVTASIFKYLTEVLAEILQENVGKVCFHYNVLQPQIFHGLVQWWLFIVEIIKNDWEINILLT